MKIYEQSRQEARKRIEARITVLNTWIAEGIPWQTTEDGKELRDSNGELIPEFIPASFTEFAEWSSKFNSASIVNKIYSHAEKSARISDFGTLSRTTLNQKYNQSLKSIVKELMSTAASCLIAQQERENKYSIIASKNSEISYLKLVIQSQERELKLSRLNERVAITENRREHEQRVRNEAEFHCLINKLETRVSELTQVLAKVTPLKTTKREKP